MKKWLNLERELPTKKKVSKGSGIIQLAEVRLSRGAKGSQHDIETHIFDFETEEKQRVNHARVRQAMIRDIT